MYTFLGLNEISVAIWNIFKLYQFDIRRWFDNAFWPPYQKEKKGE